MDEFEEQQYPTSVYYTGYMCYIVGNEQKGNSGQYQFPAITQQTSHIDPIFSLQNGNTDPLIIPLTNNTDPLIIPLTNNTDPLIIPLTNNTNLPIIPLTNNTNLPIIPLTNNIHPLIIPLTNNTNLPIIPLTNNTNLPIIPLTNNTNLPIIPLTNNIHPLIIPLTNNTNLPIIPLTNNTNLPIIPLTNNIHPPLSASTVQSLHQEMIQKLSYCDTTSGDLVYAQLMARKKEVEKQHSISLPIPRVAHDDQGRYFIELQDYVRFSQNIVSKFMGISNSALSRHWRQNNSDQKWPYRKILQLENRLSLMNKNNPDFLMLSQKLETLLSKYSQKVLIPLCKPERNVGIKVKPYILI